MAIRPFVINRDIQSLPDNDKRNVLIDVSEYDGMVESHSVQPLNRYTASQAIESWDCEEDYFIDNEYTIMFAMQYHKSDGIPVVITHRVEERKGTLADYNKINKLREQVLLDLDEPGTVVHDLLIRGMTARKMWYRIETETLDFVTPV